MWCSPVSASTSVERIFLLLITPSEVQRAFGEDTAVFVPQILVSRPATVGEIARNGVMTYDRNRTTGDGTYTHGIRRFDLLYRLLDLAGRARGRAGGATLTAAAAATKKLKVATGICLVIQRDTIQTAKLVASIDQVSGGRFLFGIGGGWNAEEIEDHGTEFASRFKKMREQIEGMKEIWTQSKPEYHGDIVDFPTMMTWPKPVQKPHPPVIVGGAFPWAARRAVRYGDGWYPNASSGNPDEYMPRFRQMAAEAGRDPETLPVTIGGSPEDPDRVKRFRDLGAARVNVSLPAEKADEILPVLDRWVSLIRQLRA